MHVCVSWAISFSLVHRRKKNHQIAYDGFVFLSTLLLFCSFALFTNHVFVCIFHLNNIWTFRHTYSPIRPFDYLWAFSWLINISSSNKHLSRNVYYYHYFELCFLFRYFATFFFFLNICSSCHSLQRSLPYIMYNSIWYMMYVIWCVN